MFAKTVLWLTAAILGGYGVACAISPELPAGYIGYTLTNADARIEAAAMYGGVQTAIGLFCILAALKPAYTRTGLVVVLFVFVGLASTRLLGFLMSADPTTVYTHGALVYEITTLVFAAIALRLHNSDAAA